MSDNHLYLENVNLHYSGLAFRERSLKSWLGNLLRPGKKRAEPRDIHALKNINLEICSGERVALLGHNGAGKSTLLKTIAGLYPISTGKLIVDGEVRTLFDLSLGFEPDATGRENILYRGLLLGLSPDFIRELESEVVAFAELGEFIDYPVKTYSAGMQVRLAFAVSTVTSGDILLLDEVMGAGDAMFMIKAQRRIFDLVKQSKILIFASHNFAAVQDLCARGVVLHHGELMFDGAISDAIEAFNEVNKLTK